LPSERAESIIIRSIRRFDSMYPSLVGRQLVGDVSNYGSQGPVGRPLALTVLNRWRQTFIKCLLSRVARRVRICSIHVHATVVLALVGVCAWEMTDFRLASNFWVTSAH